MSEQAMILWGFGLLAASLLLFVIEVFIPSAGVITLTAAVTAIAAIVVFWRVSPVWGVTSLLLVLVLAPMALNFGFRLMPHTPVGKKMILSEDEETARKRLIEEQKQEQARQALIGAEGVALTPLRAVGTVEIDGTRLEALAEGGAIETGARVRITAIDSNQIRVRRIV